MPTFEKNNSAPVPTPETPEEFRPRRRGEWQGAFDETFDPAPIPPAVKQSIDRRVNDMIRQSRGPDETLYAIREWLSVAKRVVANLPVIFKDVILGRVDDSGDEE